MSGSICNFTVGVHAQKKGGVDPQAEGDEENDGDDLACSLANCVDPGAQRPGQRVVDLSPHVPSRLLP